MLQIRLILIVTIAATSFSFDVIAAPIAKKNELIGKIEQTLSKLVKEQRAQAGLVGLGATLMQNGKIIASSVDGTRKKGSDVPLTTNDLWHIGSVTKSFTATMIARLVEKGELSWNTKIEDIYQEHSNIHKDWRDVTLTQLLTHTSGATANFSIFDSGKNPAEGKMRMAARESAVLEILSSKPNATPGSKFAYSNVGFTIAGTLAEKKTGLPWEMLIRNEIFSPLKIKSGGFGIPEADSKEITQPHGHRTFFGFTSSNQTDNTPIIGPAGTIHMSMSDLLTYANEHLIGKHGQGALLKKETYKKLHTPILENYAFGWVRIKRDWANGEVIWHNGSNTSWYTLVVLIPDIDVVMVINSNHGKIKQAEKSAWKIVKKLTLLLQQK